MNFWWGFCYLAQEPFSCMRNPPLCDYWGEGAGTPLSTVEQPKLASPVYILSTWRFPIWITQCGVTFKVAGHAEYLAFTLPTPLCPTLPWEPDLRGYVNSFLCPLVSGWVQIMGAGRMARKRVQS